MTPRHHLDPATVLGHAAAALAPEAAAIVAVHLEGCAHCRAAVARAEQVGGLLLEHQHVQAAPDAHRERLRADMLQRLERDLPAAPPRPWQDAPEPDPDRLPAPLHPYFGERYSGLRWRWNRSDLATVRHGGTGAGA